MKTTTIPPLRVSPELREQAEAVLENGETLSSFMLEALRHSIDLRQTKQEFIDRGLASAAKAKKTGKYVSADRVIDRLTRQLSAAKSRVA